MSAASERLFSTSKMIWSDRRTRLLKARMWMLAFVYFHSRVMKRRAAQMAQLADRDSETERWTRKLNDEDECKQQQKEQQIQQGEQSEQQQQQEQKEEQEQEQEEEREQDQQQHTDDGDCDKDNGLSDSK